MSFSEFCIYQVKPDKVKAFEEVMNEALPAMERQEGVLLLRFARRDYVYREFERIRQGQPPQKLTRIVKCVRYMLYWEFESIEAYGAAQQALYQSHWKSIDKCLLVPHDKFLGETLISLPE